MKLRPLLVLLLFVASAGILVWIYYASTHNQHITKQSAWEETLADLDACGRHKHVKAAQYDHFAQIAEQEGKPEAASLFQALAFSERLNEQNCANAIIRLGGSYQPPVKVVVFHGTTNDNLTRSISYERQMLDQLEGNDIRRAFDKGNRYAARVLVWAAASDMRHIALMQTYRDRAPSTIPTASHTNNDIRRVATSAPITSMLGMDEKPASLKTKYLVCPVCGNTYARNTRDVYCPFCLTDCRLFIEFE